jgi:hypothetical protein
MGSTILITLEEEGGEWFARRSFLPKTEDNILARGATWEEAFRKAEEHYYAKHPYSRITLTPGFVHNPATQELNADDETSALP